MAGGRYTKLDEEERVLNESWLDVLRVGSLVAGLAVLVWAVVTGLRWVVHEGTHWLFSAVMEHGLLGAWALLALLAVGGMIRILLIKRFGWGDAAGDGMAVALENYHITYEHEDDDPQPRYQKPTWGLAVRKSIMTLLTLLTGASGGLESPVVLIAESIGAGWSRLTRTVSEHELRTYQLSAIGAAVGALLGAPFAAALFATEIAYADRIIYRKFAFALFASIIAYILNNHVAGFDPLFVAAPHDRLYSFTEYGVTSLVAVAVSAPIALGFGLLVTLGKGVTERHGTFAVGILAPIAAGAIALAMWWGLGLELQHILGGGEATIHDLLNPIVEAPHGAEHHGEAAHHAAAHPLGLPTASLGVWWVLLIALAGRMLTTGLTLQSGGSAGLLIPAMVMGGVGGAIVGQLINLTGLFPVMDTTPFVVSGIASALVAVVGVPLAAIALVLEVFGAAYGPPAILAVGLTYVLTVRFTVYRSQRQSSDLDADETGGVAPSG